MQGEREREFTPFRPHRADAGAARTSPGRYHNRVFNHCVEQQNAGVPNLFFFFLLFPCPFLLSSPSPPGAGVVPGRAPLALPPPCRFALRLPSAPASCRPAAPPLGTRQPAHPCGLPGAARPGPGPARAELPCAPCGRCPGRAHGRCDCGRWRRSVMRPTDA